MDGNLIAIDPGVHVYGWALFRYGRLEACGLGKTAETWRPHVEGVAWVCERPEQRGKGSRVRVSDLLDLTLAAGRIVGANKCEFFTPSKWKGQLKKDAHHRRMFEELNGVEHAVLEGGVACCNKDTILDVNDAVCLGLWRLGRIV